MAQFDQTCDSVLRAAYQVSAFTGARVSYEQVKAVVSLAKEEFAEVVRVSQSRGMIPADVPPEFIALTAKGLAYAATLASLSEPPLFLDI